MAAPFAALEARLNGAALSRLANCAGTLAGAAIEGIYDAPYRVAPLGDAGVMVTERTVTVLTSSVPASPWGASLIVTEGSGVGSYVVREHHPDGAGMSVLVLEVAALPANTPQALAIDFAADAYASEQP